MATPQEIQRLLNDIQQQYDRLGKTNPFKDFDPSKISDARAATQQLEAGLRDVNRRINDLNNDMDGVVSAFQSTVDEIKKQNSALGNSTKALSGLQSIAQKLLYDQQGISKLNTKQLTSLKEQAKQKESDLKSSKIALEREIEKLRLEGESADKIDQRVMALQAVNGQLEDEAGNLQFITDRLQQRLTQEEQITEYLGLGGAIIGSTKGALDKLGMSGLADKLGFDEASEKMREVSEGIIGLDNELVALNKNNLSAAQIRAGFGGKELKSLQERRDALEGMGGKVEVLTAGFKSMGSSLLKNLKDPLSAGLFIVTQLVQALSSVDKMTGDVAKNLGMSYKEANNMVSDMTDIANLSGDAHVSTEGLVQSQLALSKALGTNSQISGELLTDFTKLTEQAGFSAEAMTNLSMISQGTGKSLQDNTSELLGQAKVFNINNGLALNEKELVEAVANTSAATVLTLGKSSKALIENAAAAKQFGVNLQQAENIAGSLLDFQSSIESEMEAELLTGKQLNLEQARMLALKGETGKAAAEVLKQVGGSAEFSEMNVIAQEALAKSMGMTRDELAKSLIEREALAKIGMADMSAQDAYNKMRKEGLSDDQIAKKLGNENLANQLKSESAQKRFAAITAKLQDLFVGIAEPILAIVNPLLNLVTSVLPAINFLLQPIKTTFNGISKILTGDFGSLSGMQAVLGGIAVVLGTIVGLGRIQESLTEGTLSKLKESLSIETLISTQEAFQVARKEGKNVLEATSLALEKSKLGTLILQGAQLAAASALKVKDFILDKASLALTLAQNAAALVYNGILAVANAIKLGGLLPLVASMAMTAFSSLAAIPFIGPILGIAGAAAALALGYGFYSKAQSAGDMYSPADGKTQVSTKEGGLFELSKNDDLVAAPGAANALSNNGEGGASPSGGINIAPLVAQMSQMNATLNAILSKEGTVTLDGTKVGTALTVASSKLQ